MSCARTFQQARRYLFSCAAGIASIFFFANASAAQIAPASQLPQAPWAQELNKYPGLLPEAAQLFAKLQENVQSPAPRSESRLLPLLPESTVFYGAFPNYGDAARQALQVFRQELQDSSVLRDWWTHGEMATNGPQIEDSLEKFSQFHQYLGDEIVVSGTMGSKEPNLLLFAEVRKPGLKKYLEQTIAQLSVKSKPGVRVLDVQELATAKSKAPDQEFFVLVRPDFLAGASDLATLRSFSAKLDRGSREFALSPFGKRILQEYQSGATVLAAADIHKFLEQAPPATQQNVGFQNSGFADMKYMVWKHTKLGGQSVSQAELSFTSPRRGAASWLAKPRPLGSLNFVSPEAVLVGSLVLTSPAQIFDDLKELSGPSSANAFAGIAAGEKALNLSLKDDLLGQLTGELTLELDNFTPPHPAWKAILKVNDANRLQRTLSTLLALAHFEGEPLDERGITYHSVKVPSKPAPIEIGYAFVDGYLVIGSTHDAVAEAARLHGSGGSLAKSGKFLAALPPGHSSAASALLYQHPLAMTAMQMRQFSPELADALTLFSKQASPSVVSLYGEESAIREEGVSGALDVPTVLIVAAIAIPNLVRSRAAANEASAVGSLRTVNVAQVTYVTMYPKRGYASNLATLGPSPRGIKRAADSPDHAGLLDETLGNASCSGDAWCTKSGYHFRVTGFCKLQVCKEYIVLATPIDSNMGTRSFCSTSDGVIRSKIVAPLSSTLSVAECRTWQPLQ